jgi:multidrug transporter EmrE-like cation transporter
VSATAAVVGGAAWLAGRFRYLGAPRAPHAPLAATLGLGVALGLCNALGNQFLVLALGRVPGMLVYPFHSAVGLLISVVYSRLAWSERIRAPEAVGIALALGSVVLINLR